MSEWTNGWVLETVGQKGEGNEGTVSETEYVLLYFHYLQIFDCFGVL